MQEKLEKIEGLRVTRFAPAPTGELHIGHLWTCYFNFLIGHRHIMRVDDTNCANFNTCYVFLKRAVDTLRLFGFTFDRVVIQSLRVRAHRPWAYSRMGALLFNHQGALYLRSKGKRATFYDYFRCKQISKLLDRDTVMIRSNGLSTYQLASVYDDYVENVTDIVRSSDHIDSSFLQSVCFEHLSDKERRFWLIPLIYDQESRKLSKSKGNAWSVNQILNLGILPVSLLRYFERHRESAKPFRFDWQILRKINRAHLKYENIEKSVLLGLNKVLDRRIDLEKIFHWRQLIDSGRYGDTNQLLDEVENLWPNLTRIHDMYSRKVLEKKWMRILDTWFIKRELTPLDVEDKVYFREKLLNIDRGPSVKECLNVLLSLSRHDY